MKKLLIIFLLFGCSDTNYEKPFVIIDADMWGNRTTYIYQDANGLRRHFDAPNNSYQVGDTIY